MSFTTVVKGMWGSFIKLGAEPTHVVDPGKPMWARDYTGTSMAEQLLRSRKDMTEQERRDLFEGNFAPQSREEMRLEMVAKRRKKRAAGSSTRSVDPRHRAGKGAGDVTAAHDEFDGIASVEITEKRIVIPEPVKAPPLSETITQNANFGRF